MKKLKMFQMFLFCIGPDSKEFTASFPKSETRKYKSLRTPLAFKDRLRGRKNILANNRTIAEIYVIKYESR